MIDIYAKIVELKKAGMRSALCTLTETKGSVPRKAGAKMIVTAQNEVYGTVGGGAVEMEIIGNAARIIAENKSAKFRFDLEEQLEMHCGGMVEVFIEPLIPNYPLIIFGAGHVGMALARLAKQFGFSVTLMDNRESLLKTIQNEGFETVHGEFSALAAELETSENSFLVVATPKHQFDETVTGILGVKPFKYLGMIGSRKKVAVAIENFRQQKILTDEQISRIDMPIGVPFNAQTPEEIAVSILAKLIDVKNS
jgi:xanthine dehydrogenase accessory factor